MTIAMLVVSILLALAFIAAGVAKIRRQEPVTGTLARLGVSPGLQRTIGILEVLGGLGVAAGSGAILAGLSIAPLGLAALVGLALLMLGALAYHLKARDSLRESSGSLVLLALVALVGALQASTI